MIPVPFSHAICRQIAPLALCVIVLTFAVPAAGQGLVEYSVEFLPLPSGYHASYAMGMSDGDWDPPIVVGRVVNATCMASCWIRVQQQWSAHVLPGLAAGMDSWANGVVHVPDVQGLWTAVVGASMDDTGALKPVLWDTQDEIAWDMTPLPVLNGGQGEAMAIFKPDGVPLRAIACGWADETPPVAAAPGSSQMGLRVPMIWEATATGERLLRPAFGAGLEGHVNDIGLIPAPNDPFVAFGGGQNAVGAWMPQMWTSTDDGETWSNDPLPLPVTMGSGEATAFDYDAAGNIVRVAGWGTEATRGLTMPLMWERDLSLPTSPWIIHELQLPSGGTEGGQNAVVRKRPGRTTYAASTMSNNQEMVLWVDDGSGSWTALTPADYLVDPQVGIPMYPAGENKKFDAIATEMGTATGGGGLAPAQMDTLAAVLVPTTLTGAERRTPSFITLSASPNPFAAGLRVGYALPHTARVTVTIHDVRGAVVAHFDEGVVPAGEARDVHWNGMLHRGKRAASGVYFVRVATPYDVSTVKVVRIE